MQSNQSILEKIFSIMYKVQCVFASASLFMLAVMIVIQVFMRYILKSPLFGIEEAETFPMIWVYFLGGSMASYERTHIQCGIAPVVCKNPKILYVVDIVKDILSAILSGLLTYWMFQFAAYCLKKNQTSALLDIPMILAQGMLFIALFFVTIFCLRDLFDFKTRNEKYMGGDK